MIFSYYLLSLFCVYTYVPLFIPYLICAFSINVSKLINRFFIKNQLLALSLSDVFLFLWFLLFLPYAF